MPEPINMKPIVDALGKELDQGIRFIHIWDYEHNNPAPRELYSSPELFRLVKQYGMPIYVLEETNPEITPRLIMGLNKFSAEELANLYLNADPAGVDRMYANIAQFGKDENVGLLMPDPRRELYHLVTPEEWEIHERSIKAIAGLPSQDVSDGLKKFRDSLTDEEKIIYESALDNILKFSTMGDGGRDTSQTDYWIAHNIHEALEPFNRGEGIPPVVLTIWGADHYNKPNDLDEKLTGVSIGVMQRPGPHRAQYLGYGSDDDVPEYAYYAEDQRFVKLDNDRDRAEFMGLTSEEYALYRSSGGLPNLAPMQVTEANPAPEGGHRPSAAPAPQPATSQEATPLR